MGKCAFWLRNKGTKSRYDFNVSEHEEDIRAIATIIQWKNSQKHYECSASNN